MKKFLLVPFLLLMIACGDDSNEETPVPEESKRPTMNVQDSLAMVAFYHSMKCAEWKEPYHWDLADYTTWGGIEGELDKTNNEYRITGINLNNISLLPDGYSLPAELGNLSKLRSVIIYGDQRASGGIPPELFNCPLEVLLIYGGYGGHGGFSGTIPKEIGKVANTLTYLCIANTSIGGELPEEIGDLQNLETCAILSGNNFVGKVPLFFRYLKNGVNLSFNFFSEMDWRYFTEDIGLVPQLTDNHLRGEVPEEVLTTQRWKENWTSVYNQAKGYGYDNKYFFDWYK